jgi:hypothetical protein
VRYDFSIPQYNSLNNLQETFHNHSGSNASTDDAEALENGSKRVDKEKNVQKSYSFLSIVQIQSAPRAIIVSL